MDDVYVDWTLQIDANIPNDTVICQDADGVTIPRYYYDFDWDIECYGTDLSELSEEDLSSLADEVFRAMKNYEHDFVFETDEGENIDVSITYDDRLLSPKLIDEEGIEDEIFSYMRYDIENGEMDGSVEIDAKMGLYCHLEEPDIDITKESQGRVLDTQTLLGTAIYSAIVADDEDSGVIRMSREAFKQDMKILNVDVPKQEQEKKLYRCHCR